MTLQRRSYTSLPAYLQTDRNNLELAVSDDLLYEPEQAKFVSGFIGDTSKLTTQDLARTPKLIENSAIRQKYQFTVGIAQRDPDNQTFISGAFYDDLINHLALNGAIIDDPNRLFSAFYYAWSPPIDYDKIVNPSRYFWTGPGDADSNGEYITKEAAGSQSVIHQYDGSSLVAHDVTLVNGLPGAGVLGEIVEDVSTTDRLFYQWDGAAWGLINFVAAADTAVKSSYFPLDYIYVCKTGVNFNRPVVWVYRSTIGRWISLPVVIDIDTPERPVIGMIWEDATVPPARVFRIYDGSQWLLLDTGTIDPFTGGTLDHVVGLGPSGTPTTTTFLYDYSSLDDVDTWSAQNWWRSLTDLSLSDQGALTTRSQGSRPIIEFWGNIEAALGDVRTHRNQFPLFNVYAVSPSSFEIEKINNTFFPGLDTASLTASGNLIGGAAVSTIFRYDRIGGFPDEILGFHYRFGSDGSPNFLLTLERLPVTVNGSALLGYRYFRDTATDFVHSIWERTNDVLLQLPDSDGLYEIPKNLKFNPDHIITTEISRSNYINHFTSVIKSQVDFSGNPYGENNYRYSEKNLTLGATMIDPEESLQRVLAVLQTNKLDIPDAMRQMSRDYNRVMARFLTQLNNYWDDGTISTVTDTLSVTITEATDAILTQIFANRNSEFPYYYSVMGTYIETRIISGSISIFDTTPLSIFIPNSAAQIGASPAYLPEKFIDDDGVLKIRGHDGSLIPAYDDPRDDVILDLETRFYDSVPGYMKDETLTFSGRFNSTFHLEDYYGNFIPNLTAGTIVMIVPDYTAIGSPVTNDRLYSTNQQVFATWDSTRWVTKNASVNDVFFNQDDSKYYIFNGFFAKEIVTFNRPVDFDYSENEFRAVLQREFERWVVVHSLDFTTNNDYDPNDIFTWNFASAGVEGNWRGIYRRLYRTIRPHSHPWEVVGYTVRPDWWFTYYVPTSFSSDGTPRYASTHAMWADFQIGVIRPFTSPVTIVAAEVMVAPIPVDINGELMNPISIGIVDEQALTPSSLGDDWAYGDGGPIEQRFYDSYYFQFANALAGYLMKTSLFVDRTWSEFYRQIGSTGNVLWNAPHIVFNNTFTRPAVADVASQLSLDANGNPVQNPGLNSWIAEYTNIIGLSANLDFNQAIKYSQATLGWKSSGFINPKRTRFELLDGDEVPSEDINVVLHQGPSLNEYFQSGIIIVRDTDGFRVFGTDVLSPYFPVDAGAKPIAGGSIELTDGFTYDGTRLHPVSDPSISYTRDAITVTQVTIPPITNDTAIFSVLINGFRVADKFIQRIDSTHFSIDQVLRLLAGDSIVVSVITTVSNPSTQLGSFTVNGTQITYFATGTGQIVHYPYGTLFQTLSDVVNMMVGYGRYLSSQGWIFERMTNGNLRDWLGAAQTFAIWSTELTKKFRGNPLLMKGQVFQFSVMGRRAEFTAPFGMILGVEEIRNGSYGVVDVDGKPIRSKHLSVVSTTGNMVVTSDTTDIFGLRLYLNEVQHVVFFPNTTIFNDVIYEPAFGLVRDAMIVDTYRTTNWNGRMEAPGFLINGGNLYPNWEKQVNDVTRYYNRFNPPDDPILTGMARNMFGYIPQNYMAELAIDDRNRFNFFHGSLKSKGTFQPYQAYIRGTTLGSDNVSISEDWAWKFARFGDARQVVVLFTVNNTDFVDIFQAIRFDDQSFSYQFIGDMRTACFSVPKRFDPAKVVVTVDGALKSLATDYTATPTADGYDICFYIPPLLGTVVVVSLNDNLIHPVQDTFYQASSTSVTFPNLVRTANIILSLDGLLGIADYNYSASVNTLSYSGGTAYGLVFGDLSGDLFRHVNYSGDGFTTEFSTGISSQTTSSVIVAVNGLLKRPGVDYVIDNVTEAPLSLVQTTFTPNLNDVVSIIAATNVALVRSAFGSFTGNGSRVDFSVPGITVSNYREVLVSVNGLIQVGPIPGLPIPNTYIMAFGGIRFTTAPAAGAQVNLYVIVDTAAEVAEDNEDDRVIHIPPFSPPAEDNRWVVPPQQDLYRDQPYHFPTTRTGGVDFGKYLFTASIVDQNAEQAAVTMFHWDPARDLHEPLALSNVDYKTPYDPARYNNGPFTETLTGLVWGEQQIGQVWWDTSVVLYSDYEGYLPDFMRVTREWGKLKYFNATIVRENDIVTVTTIDPKTGSITAHGLTANQTVVISGADQPTYNGSISVTVESASTFSFIVNVQADTPGTGNIIVQIGLINCYEWVASPVPPAAWDVFIGAQDRSGFNLYAGTVYNTDNPSYVTREVWDVNGNSTVTYYFWVQSNTRLITGKDIAVLDIAGRLRNPAQYEVPYFGIIDSETMFVFAGDTVPEDNYGIEITYYWYEMPRHIEWILFGEGDDFMSIPDLVIDKVLDSLLGTDIHGNPVPNITLAPDEKYGSCFFPAQTIFPDIDKALTIYLDVINSLLEGIDINTAFTLFSNLNPANEKTNLNPDGFWERTTQWDPSVDHTVVYDTVITYAERTFRTNAGLYAAGDIIKLIESDQVDAFSTSTQVPAYYQFDGTSWNQIGAVNHAILINENVVNDAIIFRNFFDYLRQDATKLQLNRIAFAVLFEMLRQNPNCDWFFKTSYIDLHSTQNLTMSAYVFPDQATLIKQAVLDLKPFRTKLRDEAVTLVAPDEDVDVRIQETQVERYSLIFDRVACNLNDENAWDTVPWDATATYPETDVITIPFTGDGVRQCFLLPEAVPIEDIFVFVNGHIKTYYIDFTFDPITFELCFVVVPGLGDQISVVIDGPFVYFGNFEYTFGGNGVTNNEILPDRIAETKVSHVFTSANGVYQRPITDFVLQVTSDTEVIYNVPPPSGVVAHGIAFGGVTDTIFTVVAYTGDGSTVEFDTTLSNQTIDSVIIQIDGVWQAPGVDFGIDDVFSPPNSSVVFGTAPGNGATVVIYALTEPGNVDTHSYVFVGDGSTTTFAVPNLAALHPPIVFVNLDGIQQNVQLADFTTDATGVVFVTAPRSGVIVTVYAVGAGIGHRLTAGTYPQTIQWDWAFWNYADLGRQEYDFAGFFLGNDISDSFTVTIPQQSSLLYAVIIKFFQNGVLVTADDLGLTISTSKLATGVIVFLSGILPSDTYAALYVSRGLYEGLEPTFGFQDPNGVVFEPISSTYQHFFARLISADFDPSTVEDGCPNNAPEERIQTEIEDLWTIAVKTYIESFPSIDVTSMTGNSVIADVGTFAFFIDTNPPLIGRAATARVGHFTIGIDPPPFDMTGVGVTAVVGSLTVAIAPPTTGDAAIGQAGVFTFLIDTNPGLTGVSTTAVTGVVRAATSLGVLAGQSSTATAGSFVPRVSFTLPGVGSTSGTGVFDFQEDSNPDLIGDQVTAQLADIELPQFEHMGLSVTTAVGAFAPNADEGAFATARVGRIRPNVRIRLPSVSATAQVGTMYPSPVRVIVSGQAATAQRGTLGIGIAH